MMAVLGIGGLLAYAQPVSDIGYAIPRGGRSRSGYDSSRGATPTPTATRPGATATPTGTGGRSTAGRARPTATARPTTVARGGTTTGSRAASKPAAGQASSASAGTVGQLKEVTRAMVESVKTRTVEFDEEELRQNPSVIILNERKYKPESSRVERESKQRSSIVEPL